MYVTIDLLYKTEPNSKSLVDGMTKPAFRPERRSSDKIPLCLLEHLIVHFDTCCWFSW